MLNSMRMGILIALGCGAIASANPFSTSGWARVDSPGGNFTVMMPGAPQLQTPTESVPQGPVPVHAYILSTPEGEAYGVSYRDYPFQLVPGNLTELRTSQVKNGQIIAQTDVTLNGHQGNLTTFTLDGKTWVTENFIVGSRLYQVIYIGSALGAATHGAPFVKSFQFTN